MSDVRLAAWMPATRATDNTSPFFTSRLAIASIVAGWANTLQRATARRCDGSFGVTSTMRARPSGSRWLNVRSLIRDATLLNQPRPRGYPTRTVDEQACQTSGSRLDGTGVHHLERRSGDRLQLREIVVVPARMRAALEEPVAAVVGHDQA